ncbi:MAG: acyltransferase family protein [Eubacteriales bacterium]
MEKQRIMYLDMAKGIGIILVVVGHSTLASDQVITWLASFHMPLFFIISGMLIWQIGEEKKPFLLSIKRKAKSIMIPFLTFNIIYLIINCLNLIRMPDLITPSQIWDAAYQAITLYGISVLWFLPALFVSQITFLALRKIPKGRDIVTVISVLLLGAIAVSGKPLVEQLPIVGLRYFCSMLLRSSAAFVFVTVGYYTKKYVLKEREQPSLMELLLGIGCCGLVVYLSFITPSVDMNFLVFGNPLTYYSIAIIGTMGVVLICKNIKTIGTLTFLGENSLVIMATHMDCQILTLSFLFASIANNISPFAKVYVYYGTFVVVLVTMELITIYIFNHYLYFLIGRKRPN